jgi:hypothetical protein
MEEDSEKKSEFDLPSKDEERKEQNKKERREKY